MRKIVFGLVWAFCVGAFMSGCSFYFLGLESQSGVNVMKNAANLRAEIIEYERKNRVEYVYKFRDLNSGKIYKATSSRYYYNGGDKAYISIIEGRISNMKLISRKLNISTKKKYETQPQIIRKNINKNQNIAVPKSEVISF